jgi:hypothetical protein
MGMSQVWAIRGYPPNNIVVSFVRSLIKIKLVEWITESRF